MARENQKQRTRLALIDAAAAMAREGKPFSVAEVAEAAMVSTATAYRYFPNPQSLWAELAVLPSQAQKVDFAQLIDDTGEDPDERVDTLIRYVADMQFGDEAPWRALIKASLERWFAQGADAPQLPVRGENRMLMTRKALEPLQGVVPPEVHRKLTMALMLVFGVEAMIVARDACHLEQAEATEVMTWAAQALLQAARAESS